MTLIAQLKRDEGTGPIDHEGRFHPYKDSVGKLTIGYGRNLDDGGISKDEACLLLNNDVIATASQLHAFLPWTDSLDEARRGVLINMAFNMGIYSLLKFKTTLALTEAGDYAGAAKQMLNSLWASQVGSRAHRLALQMESGQWQ